MNSQDIIAAVYGRVSDESKQGENFSIGTQLVKMREWVIAQGWDAAYELSEKESAYLEGLSRSELNKVLDLARAGKINVLVFFSPDRFTRDMADGVILRRELKRHGVRLFCYYPTPHEISSDMEIMNILTDWQSQMFIERMREASMRGLQGKVEMGLYPQGHPPYGYRLEGKKRETRIFIYDEEADWVGKIFHWYYYENIGSSEIAKRLNDMGAPLPTSSLGSKTWTNRLVRHILSNESYAGVWYAYKWKKVGKRKFQARPKEERKPVPIPAIVSRSMWEEVQRKLASRHVGRDAKGTYLLSSRVSCICGSSARGARNTSWYTRKDGQRMAYVWYRCCSREQKKGFCGAPNFNAHAIDDTVWNFAYELIHNPEKLLRGYRQYQEESQEEQSTLTTQIEGLEERIQEQQILLSDLIKRRDAARSQSLMHMLDEQCETVGATIDGMEARLAALYEQQTDAPFTDEHIEAAIAEIAELRKMYEALKTIDEEADFEAKRVLINLLNLRATLYVKDNGEHWVDIHWLRKVYPRLVSSKNNNPTRQSQASSAASASRAGGW